MCSQKQKFLDKECGQAEKGLQRATEEALSEDAVEK